MARCCDRFIFTFGGVRGEESVEWCLAMPSEEFAGLKRVDRVVRLVQRAGQRPRPYEKFEILHCF